MGKVPEKMEFLRFASFPPSVGSLGVSYQTHGSGISGMCGGWGGGRVGVGCLSLPVIGIFRDIKATPNPAKSRQREAKSVLQGASG